MKLRIRMGERIAEVDLDEGTSTVGGDGTDTHRISGLEGCFLKLERVGDHLSVTCARSIRLGPVKLAAAIPRVLGPGEVIETEGNIEVERVGRSAGSVDPRETVLTLLRGANDERKFEGGPALVCLTGLDAGRIFPLGDEEVEIGRGYVGIRLRDRAVSRVHARVRREMDGYWVTRERGRNGLFINGLPVLRVRLRRGDVIELGRTVLRFEEHAAEPPPHAPAPSRPTSARHRAMEMGMTALAIALTFAGVLLTAGTWP